jgi:hypothetical protein
LQAAEKGLAAWFAVQRAEGEVVVMRVRFEILSTLAISLLVIVPVQAQHQHQHPNPPPEQPPAERPQHEGHQEPAKPAEPEHEEHGMQDKSMQDMEGHEMHGMHQMSGMLGPYGMSRESSGTAWQPESSPHVGISTQCEARGS